MASPALGAVGSGAGCACGISFTAETRSTCVFSCGDSVVSGRTDGS